MKRFACLLPAPVFLLLFLSACPSGAYSRYPLGGVWEYSGSVNVTINGQQAVLRDSGRITIDSGYSYDRWGRDFDERIRRFLADGTFSVSPSPNIREDYRQSEWVNQWYNFRSFEISIDNVRYYMEITGRTRADLRYTRTIDGQRVSRFSPPPGSGGMKTGMTITVTDVLRHRGRMQYRNPPFPFFLLPLLFLCRKK